MTDLPGQVRELTTCAICGVTYRDALHYHTPVYYMEPNLRRTQYTAHLIAWDSEVDSQRFLFSRFGIFEESL